MRLLWLEPAEEDLDSIYDFYVRDKSIKAASKIYNDLLDGVEILFDFPQIASIEPELSDGSEVYRSLVVKKYFKIIYFLEEGSIYIAAIWDCRQDPKMNVAKIRKKRF